MSAHWTLAILALASSAFAQEPTALPAGAEPSGGATPADCPVPDARGWYYYDGTTFWVANRRVDGEWIFVDRNGTAHRATFMDPRQVVPSVMIEPAIVIQAGPDAVETPGVPPMDSVSMRPTLGPEARRHLLNTAPTEQGLDAFYRDLDQFYEAQRGEILPSAKPDFFIALLDNPPDAWSAILDAYRREHEAYVLLETIVHGDVARVSEAARHNGRAQEWLATVEQRGLELLALAGDHDASQAELARAFWMFGDAWLQAMGEELGLPIMGLNRVVPYHEAPPEADVFFDLAAQLWPPGDLAQYQAQFTLEHPAWDNPQEPRLNYWLDELARQGAIPLEVPNPYNVREWNFGQWYFYLNDLVVGVGGAAVAVRSGSPLPWTQGEGVLRPRGYPSLRAMDLLATDMNWSFERTARLFDGGYFDPYIPWMMELLRRQSGSGTGAGNLALPSPGTPVLGAPSSGLTVGGPPPNPLLQTYGFLFPRPAELPGAYFWLPTVTREPVQPAAEPGLGGFVGAEYIVRTFSFEPSGAGGTTNGPVASTEDDQESSGQGGQSSPASAGALSPSDSPPPADSFIQDLLATLVGFEPGAVPRDPDGELSLTQIQTTAEALAELLGVSADAIELTEEGVWRITTREGLVFYVHEEINKTVEAGSPPTALGNEQALRWALDMIYRAFETSGLSTVFPGGNLGVGEHIHVDAAIFRAHPRLFRDLLVDVYNRPELLVIFGSPGGDRVYAGGIYPSRRQQNFINAIRWIDEEAARQGGYTLELILRGLEEHMGVDYERLKYFDVNYRNLLPNPDGGPVPPQTVELRFLAGQRNTDDIVTQLKFLERYLLYLQNLDEPVQVRRWNEEDRRSSNNPFTAAQEFVSLAQAIGLPADMVERIVNGLHDRYPAIDWGTVQSDPR